jgi:phosphatidylserine decarboxylase
VERLFTRRFKAGARPVGSPDDDKVITSACESTPYGLATDVQPTASSSAQA